MYKIIGADLKEYGPITTEMLRQWITDGRVNALTKVQAEGSTEWKALGQLPEFGLSMPVSTPPTFGSAPIIAPEIQTTNNLAVWAFGVSLFSLLCCRLPGGLVSLVLGIIAFFQIKKSPGQKGQGFAIAAIIIGAVSMIVDIIILVFFLPAILEAFQHAVPK